MKIISKRFIWNKTSFEVGQKIIHTFHYVADDWKDILIKDTRVLIFGCRDGFNCDCLPEAGFSLNNAQFPAHNVFVWRKYMINFHTKMNIDPSFIFDYNLYEVNINYLSLKNKEFEIIKKYNTNECNHLMSLI